MRIAAVAELELVRFLRRRESRWTFALAFTIGLAPLVTLAWAPLHVAWEQSAVQAEIVTLAWAPHHEAWEESAMQAEIVRGVILLLELLLLPGLAYTMATSSLRDELRRGAWPVLLQAPVSSAGLVVGKAIGIAACMTLVHAVLLSGLVTLTPFLARTTAETAFEALGPLLLAWAMIPAGLADARVHAAGRGYGAFRLLNLVHWSVPVVAVLAMLPGEQPQERARLFVAMLHDAVEAPWLAVLDAALPQASSALLLVAGVEIALAGLTWQLFAAREVGA